jgi:hypothetical protein
VQFDKQKLGLKVTKSKLDSPDSLSVPLLRGTSWREPSTKDSPKIRHWFNKKVVELTTPRQVWGFRPFTSCIFNASHNLLDNKTKSSGIIIPIIFCNGLCNSDRNSWASYKTCQTNTLPLNQTSLPNLIGWYWTQDAEKNVFSNIGINLLSHNTTVLCNSIYVQFVHIAPIMVTTLYSFFPQKPTRTWAKLCCCST